MSAEEIAPVTLGDYLPLFEKQIQLVSLLVPLKELGELTKSKDFKKYLLKIPGVSNVKDVSDSEIDKEYKLVLLKESIKQLDLSDLMDEKFKEFIKDRNFKVRSYYLSLSYKEMRADEVLRQILPRGIDIPSSFENVGHIAHLNLRDEHLPYKKIIGQVILDKNKHIRTVVNKLGTINNQFRVFDMEVIAGEEDFEAEAKEHGCRYQLNFKEVYWNSRLGEEHHRITKMCSSTDVICDLFCGIGPFAIPIAKKGAVVYANDLNPRSFFYLQKNISLNKVKIKASNCDARDFFRSLRDQQKANLAPNVSRILMNYPKFAVEFLDMFIGAWNSEEQSKGVQLPIVHCYNFASDETEMKDAILKYLGCIPADLELYQVRDIAPKKLMFCATFTIPEEIAYSSSNSTKKRKIQD